MVRRFGVTAMVVLHLVSLGINKVNDIRLMFALRLNEGFATLYENFMADYVYPEYRYMDTYLTDVVQYVMEYDTNRRAMTTYVENPVNIKALFDVIAYDKCKKTDFFNLPSFIHNLNCSWKHAPNIPERSY